MNILLTGASGFIGRNLAAALGASGHTLRLVSRRHGHDFRDLTDSADWRPLLEGIDAVINSVGIIGETPRQDFATLHTAAPVALFRACAQAGVRRVVQISALGADHTAFSAYHLSKRAADEALRALDLDSFVLRPSLIYGRGGGSAELFLRLAALPWLPVIGDGQQQLQPVHIGDVVATVLRALSAMPASRPLDIVGTETLSFADWLQWMRRARGLPPAPLLRIPFRLALAAAHLGRHVHPLFAPENLRMLQKGYWADVEPLRQFLGRLPRAIAPELFFADATAPVFMEAAS